MTTSHEVPRRTFRTLSKGIQDLVSSGRTALLVSALLLAIADVTAQVRDPQPFGWTDAVSMGGAALFIAAPSVFNWNEGLPSCAPCNTGDVPWFDRWMIREPVTGFSRASDITLLAVGIAGWIDLVDERRAGRTALVASVESSLWAHAITNELKNGIGRKRPILYTDSAADYALTSANQRSFPSGHTSIAFALATSYWMSRNEMANDKPWLRWLLMTGATSIGVFRVAAAKHFPSDAVVGAAVGITSAVVIHHIKY